MARSLTCNHGTCPTPVALKAGVSRLVSVGNALVYHAAGVCGSCGARVAADTKKGLDLVEAVVNQLEESNLLAKTFVFYTSDHGYHLGHLRLSPGKSHFYEFDARVS